jgi:hypothetical protein
MKAILAAACLLWMTTAIELAWSPVIPRGALLLPIVLGVLFLLRSPGAVLLTGLALVLDWVARPTALPLCPVFLPLLSLMFLDSAQRRDGFDRPRSLFRIPAPLQVPALTLIATGLQVLSTIPFADYLTSGTSSQLLLDQFWPLLILALPGSACVSLFIQFADEFGLRRTFS